MVTRFSTRSKKWLKHLLQIFSALLVHGQYSYVQVQEQDMCHFLKSIKNRCSTNFKFLKNSYFFQVTTLWKQCCSVYWRTMEFSLSISILLISLAYYDKGSVKSIGKNLHGILLYLFLIDSGVYFNRIWCGFRTNVATICTS